MRLDNRTQREFPLPVQQAAAGDEEAFAAVMRRMAPLIRTQVARFRCSGVEEEDLAQEALVGLLAAVRRYSPTGGAAFTTYATACITNRLISVLRRRAPQAQYEQPLEEEADLPAHAHSDPLLRLQAREEADQLLRNLQRQLTPLEYKVLLTRMQQCSYREAAARLGVSTKAVDNAVQRLRRKLPAVLSFGNNGM
ncbi:MAG: sigma-70 family RNA polymerase sigma factor [Clostridia bacterium]|nr:sigma-70 family RNA polymerase sigma factor [Clostridia bacterium]